MAYKCAKLQPCYWSGTSLLLTKNSKNVYNLLYTLPINLLWFYFTKYDDVWNELNGVLRLNIDICTDLNEINLSLWDLKYYIAPKELKCAIYDGLEMKLKVH